MQESTPGDSFRDALALMRDLRERCEWDAAQTHESLRPYLIEEAHELDDAIRAGDDRLTREELGDLLLQILFHSVIAEERGAFDFYEVARSFLTKMRGRHPHLYGDGVKEPWERMKAKKRTSLVDGLPVDLPALHRAHRLQDRAAGVGFDWPDVEGPAAKVEEELAEVRDQLAREPVRTGPGGAPVLDERHARLEGELGDLLFAVAVVGRRLNVDPETALRKATRRFAERFERMRTAAEGEGIELSSLSDDELLTRFRAGR
jgi:MazG family protein